MCVCVCVCVHAFLCFSLQSYSATRVQQECNKSATSSATSSATRSRNKLLSAEPQ